MEYLKNMMINNKNSNVRMHLRNVLKTYEKPLDIPRTFNDLENFFENTPPLDYETISSNDNLKWMSILNSHTGQRKLAYGLLDFVNKSISELNCKDEDVYLVYPGASSIAASSVACFYPNIKIIMFDKDKSLKDLIPSMMKKKITLFNSLSHDILKVTTPMVGIIDWFSDETCEVIKNTLFPMSKRKYLLFVSDIRKDTDNLSIVNDMKNQMKWIMDIQSDAYMVKFRIPYLDESKKQEIYDMYNEMSKGLPIVKDKEKEGFLYLQGSLQLQSFGPQRTTELRLIHVDPSKQFSVTYYNPNLIEDIMSTFNSFYRNNALFGTFKSFDEELAEVITREIPNYNRWCMEKVFPDTFDKNYCGLFTGAKALNKLSSEHKANIINTSLFNKELNELDRKDIKLGDKIRKIIQ